MPEPKADKPYQGRKAGSFTRDKATGKLIPADPRGGEERSSEQGTQKVPTTETAKPAAPVKKGK